MNQEKRLAIFIPLYHQTVPMFLDLLDSLEVYLKFAFHIIIVDDHTTDGTYEKLRDIAKTKGNITVLRNDKNHGWGWGIFLSLVKAIKWALENLEFDVLVKLDHDSLLINFDFDRKLVNALQNDIGLGGHLQPEANRWVWDFRLRPGFKKKVKENGFFDQLNGFFWSVQTGMLGFSRKFLQELNDSGLLDKHSFAMFGTNGLVEDFLVGPLCYYLGFKAISLPFVRSTYGPKGLLQVPYQLMRDFGISAIHPVKEGLSTYKKHNTNDNIELRKYFQTLRQQDRANLASI